MSKAKKKRPQRDGKPWQAYELAAMRKKAGKVTVAEMAKTLRRTVPAVQQKAMREEISFRR